MMCSFLPSGFVVYYMLCCAFFLFCLFANFPFYHVRCKLLQEFATKDGTDRDTRTIWMRSSFRAGHEPSRFFIQKKGTVIS